MAFDTVKQVHKILISNREFLKKTILLEKSETKMDDSIFLECLAVDKNIKVPFFKFVHNFKDGCPLSGIQINHLSDTLFFFLNLVLVDFNIIPVEFFQKVVQVSFKPESGIIANLCGDIKPSLCFHVLGLIIRCQIDSQVV